MRLAPLYLMIYVITLVLALLLGLIVIQKGRQKTINILFGLYIFTLTFWVICNLFADTSSSLDATLFWTKFAVVGPLLVAPIFLNLSFIFPTGSISKLRLILIWLIPLLMFPFIPTNLNVKEVFHEPWGTDYLPGPLYYPVTILTFGYISWAISNFFTKSKKSPALIKTQLKFIGIGATLTLIIGVITSALLPLLGYARWAILAPTSTLIMFGAIAYAIVKHKLLDINLIIARSVAYTLSVLTLGGVYVVTFFFIGQTLFGFSQNNDQLVFFTMLSLVLIFLFQPILQFYNTLTMSIFYRKAYSSEQLMERVGEIIKSTLSLKTLTHQVLEELAGTIGITRGALVIKDNGGFAVHQIGYNQTPSFSENQIHNLMKGADDHLLFFDDLDENAVKMQMRHSNLSVVLPLRVKNTFHGLLTLSEKATGESYTVQDIEVLEILMPQVSVAVQNALSYEEIRRFNVTLKEEVERATTDLKKANRNLKHLDKLKDEFVFIATHELKNPVTAMRGYLSMLQEGIFGKVPEKMVEPVDQLQASNEQLVELVNDLLQIARSEAKTLSIKTEPALLTQTVEVVAGNVKPLIEQKKLTFNHKKLHEEIVVMADPQRLKEIINNLLSNAIKYSDKGEIRVSYEATETTVTTHVKDQGVGISKEDQKKLFTRFFRAEEEAAKGIPGTGLGLFIVKQLIEKMGGKIWVSSQKGEGSTFSFSLPRVK